MVGFSINGKSIGPSKNVGVKTKWVMQPNEYIISFGGRIGTWIERVEIRTNLKT